MAFTITRRTMLRGAFGTALALPPLEIMGRRGTAHAAPPKRFFVSFGGTSIGRDGQTPNQVVPTTTGPNYVPSRGLQTLTLSNTVREVSIVSGLKLPWTSVASEIPPGGRIVNFHGCTMVSQLAGTRCPTRGASPTSATADQLVADSIAAGTQHRTLALRVQPVSYAGGTNAGSRGSMSWDKSLKRVEPIVSPRLLYQSLFANFAPQTPSDAQRLTLLLERRRSVLDVVRSRSEKLMVRLGPADRARLQKHFDEVRDLERRLAAGGAAMSATCRAPANPGEDPPIGGNHDVSNPASLKYVETAGYSQEERRAELLVDFAHIALACDLTRVVSMVWTIVQCFMNMALLTGKKGDMHGIGHGSGSSLDVADNIGWHVKHFGRLAGKLRDTREVDGSTLLDHTALLLTFEGGHGFDPEGGRNNASHSSENMVVLIGGRAGGLKPGQHVAATDKHPAQVVISAMRAVGVQTGRLGDISGDIPELFR